MKTQWKAWFYLEDRHIFVHELGFVVTDAFLADIDASMKPKERARAIQDHLNHMEDVLKEERRRKSEESSVEFA